MSDEQELSSDSIAHLNELKGEMQCKVGSFDIYIIGFGQGTAQ